jgi:hypothetical protein
MRWQSIFISVYLVVQIALPLHYYTFNEDKYDERFAWRMFSPERMVKCGYEFDVGGRKLNHRRGIRSIFHEAWPNTIIRARGVVIEKMAAKLCEKFPDTPVKFRMVCTKVNGERETHGGDADLCKTKHL